MSWRSGSSMFIEFWPLIQKYMPEREDRVEFTADLLKLFVREDMDSWEVEDLHEDVRAALLRAGIEIQEPERYDDIPRLRPDLFQAINLSRMLTALGGRKRQMTFRSLPAPE